MTGGFVWWVSPQDDKSHAIPWEQASGPDDATVDTACGQLLVIEQALHTSNGKFCRPCLIKIGEGVPDHSWHD